MTTVPYASSLSPVTPSQVYALMGKRARSSRWYISAPFVGRISPLNSLFSSGAESFSGVSYPGSTRASYCSPSKMAACVIGPATPERQLAVSVPYSFLVPSAYVNSTTPRKAGFLPIIPSLPPGVIILSAHQPGVTCADKTFWASALLSIRLVISYVNERLVLA